MHEASMIPGRSYYLKIGKQTVSVNINKLKYRIDINNLQKIALKSLS